ncbi:MAG TPA: DUF302 domain-containing protein [Acetobacteraceae bacterium]|nr:DUF302 domain-containing protein [Acetobacteraceae bacterium]
MTDGSFISYVSATDFAATLGRLRGAVTGRALTIFAEVDHAAGAAEVGLVLRPTTVVIFGNARGGTPLMQAAQSMGLDLPLKMLVWEDAAGKVWVGYRDIAWLAKLHGVDAPAVPRLAEALAAIATEAAR